MLWDILWRNRNTFSLSFCLLFSLTGMIWQTNPLTGVVHFFGKLADRVSGAINSGISLPADAFRRIHQYTDLQAKYERALAQLEENRNNIDKYEQLRQENERLRAALGFPPHSNYTEVKAEVLGIRLNSITPRILINRGSDHGIEPFMPVYTYTSDENKNLIRSVVGIVAIVDRTTSIVQPLHHPDMRIGVRIVSTGQWAMLEGDSENLRRLKLRYITRDAAPDSTVFRDPLPDVEKSTVITSGGEGIFPPGIPVGQIVQKGEIDEESGGFLTAYLRPYADLDRLDYVIVMRKRPDDWSKRIQRDYSLVDNLTTEFGKPEYPELPEDKKKTERVQTISKPDEELPEKSEPNPADIPGRRLKNLQPQGQ
jgi:rod shape-determining protein MreC